MAFEINRSGLDLKSKYLDVTSNNIANANSFGFKKSINLLMCFLPGNLQKHQRP